MDGRGDPKDSTSPSVGEVELLIPKAEEETEWVVLGGEKDEGSELSEREETWLWVDC